MTELCSKPESAAATICRFPEGTAGIPAITETGLFGEIRPQTLSSREASVPLAVIQVVIQMHILWVKESMVGGGAFFV